MFYKKPKIFLKLMFLKVFQKMMLKSFLNFSEFEAQVSCQVSYSIRSLKAIGETSAGRRYSISQ